MLTPINTSTAPPRGWSVTIEGAGPEIRDCNFRAFMGAVEIRLRSNGLDTHDWKAKILDLMCRQRPDIVSEDLEAPPVRAMTGDDVLRFLRVMYETKKQGFEPVSEELQNRRIDTCLACPKMGYISCYIGCQTITELLGKFLVGRDLPKIAEIHKKSCLSCGCDCSVKTMWPLDILRTVDERTAVPPDYPSTCWVVTESAQESLG